LKGTWDTFDPPGVNLTKNTMLKDDIHQSRRDLSGRLNGII